MRSIPEFEFKGEPLSSENSEMFLNLILSKEKEVPLHASTIAEDQISKIFLLRIKTYDLKFMVTDFFFSFCVWLFIDRPGRLMILLRLCYQYWRDTEKELIGIEDFAQMFPFGTPTEVELKEMWYSQKFPDRPSLESDNLLDYPELWHPDAKEKVIDLKIDHERKKKRKNRKINYKGD